MLHVSAVLRSPWSRKFHIVLGNAMVVLHPEVTQIVKSGVDRVGFTEHVLESFVECILMKSKLGGVTVVEREVGFIPTLCSAFRPRDGVCHLRSRLVVL